MQDASALKTSCCKAWIWVLQFTSTLANGIGALSLVALREPSCTLDKLGFQSDSTTAKAKYCMIDSYTNDTQSLHAMERQLKPAETQGRSSSRT